ncbi:MAG: hypothetical protein WKG07_09725 [Hymenobacter sp.]
MPAHKLVLRTLRRSDFKAIKGDHGQGVLQHGGRLGGRRVRGPASASFLKGQIGIEDNGTAWWPRRWPSSWITATFGDKHTYAKITGNGKFDTHNADGDTLYGVDVFVDPEYRCAAPGPPPLRRPQGAVREPEPARHGGRRPHSRLRRLRRRDDARQVRGDGAQQGAGGPDSHVSSSRTSFTCAKSSAATCLTTPESKALCHAAGVD